MFYQRGLDTSSKIHQTQALYHLHKHCYKADEALSNKERHCLYKTMENWTEEECQVPHPRV